MNVSSVHTWQISLALLVRLIKDIISLDEFYLAYTLRLSQLCHLEVKQSNFLRLGKATVISEEITWELYSYTNTKLKVREWVVDRALQSLRVLWFHLLTQCTARGFLPVNSFGVMLHRISSWGMCCAWSRAGAVVSFINTCLFLLDFEASWS